MDKFNLAREILEAGRGTIELSFEEFNRRDVPEWVTRDLSTLPGASGSYLISQHIPDVLDALRPVSLVGQLPINVLSGLTGAVTLPRIATGTTGSTIAELASVSEGDPAFGAPATCQPLRITAICNFSRQLLAQSAGQGISDLVKKDLATAIAQQLDQQLISGTGINGQANGILNQVSGSTSSSGFTFGGAMTNASAYPVFIAAQKNLETLFVRPTHWLVGPATAAKARALLRGTTATRMLVDEEDGVEMLGKYPLIVTPYLLTFENVIIGDWSKVYILIWGDGLELVVNPYTLAGSGEIQIIARILYNVCVRHPAALAISDYAAT